jgi:hypothetical protein
LCAKNVVKLGNAIAKKFSATPTDHYLHNHNTKAVNLRAIAMIVNHIAILAIIFTKPVKPAIAKHIAIATRNHINVSRRRETV